MVETARGAGSAGGDTGVELFSTVNRQTLGQYVVGEAGVSAPGVPDMTLISAFAEVDEALRSRDVAQARHPYTAPVMEGAVGWLDGEEQLQRRRFEAALFRTDQLVDYERIMREALRA